MEDEIKLSTVSFACDHCIFFVCFQTKCLFSLLRDTGHHLIQNNKVGAVTASLPKSLVPKTPKEDKTGKEKDTDGKLKPGEGVGGGAGPPLRPQRCRCGLALLAT